MKRRARSNLFAVDETQYFSAARFKGSSTEQNEKGIKPFFLKKTTISTKGKEVKQVQ